MRHTFMRDFKCDTPGCDATQVRLYLYCCSDVMHQKCLKCGAEKTLDMNVEYGVAPAPQPPYKDEDEKEAAYKYYQEVVKPAADRFYATLHHTGIAELGFLGEQDARPLFKEVVKKVFHEDDPKKIDALFEGPM